MKILIDDYYLKKVLYTDKTYTKTWILYRKVKKYWFDNWNVFVKL